MVVTVKTPAQLEIERQAASAASPDAPAGAAPAQIPFDPKGDFFTSGRAAEGLGLLDPPPAIPPTIALPPSDNTIDPGLSGFTPGAAPPPDIGVPPAAADFPPELGAAIAGTGGTAGLVYDPRSGLFVDPADIVSAPGTTAAPGFQFDDSGALITGGDGDGDVDTSAITDALANAGLDTQSAQDAAAAAAAAAGDPPPEPGQTGTVSDIALGQINDFSLRGNIDNAALQRWVSDLIAGNFVVSEIREVPPGSGNFEAIEVDPVTGAETVVSVNRLGITELDDQASRIAAANAQLEQDKFALESEISREQLRIQEQIARIDQDIARDRIQADQETAAGNWQNALDIRDRVDASERAQRQLERDLFNAEQELNNRRFELERASFDLQKLEFFQSLSQTPANFADLFNLSRGLPPVGAGGPLPQGVQRVAGPSDVQQTAAQDFRLSGIDLGVNAASGALPTLKGEGAAPTFDPSQTQLSFLAGGDPTPVDLAGLPPAAPGAGVGNIGGGGETSAIFNAEQGGVTGDAPPAVPFAPPGEVVEDLNAVPVAPQTVVNTDALTSAGVNAPMQQPITTETLTPTQGGPTTAVDPQGAPLPPGLQIAFGGGLPGAPQTLPNSVPLLSPQQLAQLTPAEREAYFSIAQMQGQFLPDYQNLLAARGAPTEYQGSQRVFA